MVDETQENQEGIENIENSTNASDDDWADDDPEAEYSDNIPDGWNEDSDLCSEDNVITQKPSGGTDPTVDDYEDYEDQEQQNVTSNGVTIE